MHLSLATVMAIIPLLASATPLAQFPRITMPISKRTTLRRDDGSVNIEALKASVAAVTAYCLPFDRLIYDLTSSVVVELILAKNLTTPSVPSMKGFTPMLSPVLQMITGIVRIFNSPE
jgi:hypothetical protein